MGDSRAAIRRRMTMEVMKRCAAPIRRNVKALRGLIKCGVQGCVFRSTEHQVVKVTPIGEAKIRREKKRSHTTRESPDEAALRDYTGTGWIKHHQSTVSIEGPQPSLPHIRRMFGLKDCLAGTKIKRAFVVEREDLEDLPKEWVKWIHKPFVRVHGEAWDVIRLLQDLEDIMGDEGVHPRDWARGKEPREWILRLRRSGNFVAWFLFREIFDLQEWLSKRRAMVYDLDVTNLGLRSYGGGQKQIVIRDTGCIVAFPGQREWGEKVARRYTQAIGAPPFPW